MATNQGWMQLLIGHPAHFVKYRTEYSNKRLGEPTNCRPCLTSALGKPRGWKHTVAVDEPAHKNDGTSGAGGTNWRWGVGRYIYSVRRYISARVYMYILHTTAASSLGVAFPNLGGVCGLPTRQTCPSLRQVAGLRSASQLIQWLVGNLLH